MERTMNDIIREQEEDEGEVEWVVVGETETVWGKNFEPEG